MAETQTDPKDVGDLLRSLIEEEGIGPEDIVVFVVTDSDEDRDKIVRALEDRALVEG